MKSDQTFHTFLARFARNALHLLSETLHALPETLNDLHKTLKVYTKRFFPITDSDPSVGFYNFVYGIEPLTVSRFQNDDGLRIAQKHNQCIMATLRQIIVCILMRFN